MSSYETNMKRLEEITAKLRDPATPLDESIRLFEEGTALSEEIEKTLSEHEGKIEKLLNPEGDREDFGDDFTGF